MHRSSCTGAAGQRSFLSEATGTCVWELARANSLRSPVRCAIEVAERSARSGRKPDEPAVAVASYAQTVAVLQARTYAHLLWERHPTLLVDDRLTAAPQRALILCELESWPRPEWGRQDSNLRRQSLTLYRRRPLTAWILPRPGRRFYRPVLAVHETIDRGSRLDLELRVLGASERDRAPSLEHHGRDEPSTAVAGKREEVLEPSWVDLLRSPAPALIPTARCECNRAARMPICRRHALG